MGASASKRPRNEMDDVLCKVADALTDNSQIEKLGKELGFSVPDIARFIATNVKGAHVTTDGTKLMLRTWSEGIESSRMIPTLVNALRNADMIQVANSIQRGALSRHTSSRKFSLQSTITYVEYNHHLLLFIH